MDHRCFAYGARGVRVECADPAHLRWLEEFLMPAFAVDRERVAECVVELIADDARYRALLATRPPGVLPETLCFVLDQGALCAPWWSAVPGQRVIAHDQHRVIYVVDDDGSRVEIVSPRDNPRVRPALMRVVRERAMAAAWTHASLVLHAAAIAVTGRGIVIAGPKHAGKTSLLIHCLHAPGVHFVSNDRVVLDLSEAQPIARGMPTIVSIHQETLRFFPTLVARLQGGQFHSRLTLSEARQQAPAPIDVPRSVSLSPVQLCHLLGGSMAGEVAASVLVLPRVDPAVQGLAVRPLTPEETNARLTDVLFAAAATERTSEVFRVTPRSAHTEPATLRRLWREATAHVPAFECLLGEGAFRPSLAADFVEHVLSAPH